MRTATSTKHYSYNDYRHNPVSFYDDIAVDVLGVVTSSEFIDHVKNAPVEADRTNGYDMVQYYPQMLQKMLNSNFSLSRKDAHEQYQDFLARLIHTMYASNTDWPSQKMSVEDVRKYFLNSLINIETVAYDADFRKKAVYHCLSGLEFAENNKSAAEIEKLQTEMFFIAVIAYFVVA